MLALAHLILIPILRCKYYKYHFTDEEIEAKDMCSVPGLF